MKLRVRAFGLAIGMLLGLAFCLGTIVSVLFGAGLTFGHFASFLPYLERSFFGIVYGLVGGFIEGFLVGAFVAWVYNTSCKALYKSELGVK